METVAYQQWWIFKIGDLRQNSNKGPRKIDETINNCDQTTLPSTTLQSRLWIAAKKLMKIHWDIFIIKTIR